MSRDLLAGFCVVQETKVRIPMAVEFLSWTARYVSPLRASEACARLTEALVMSDEPEAKDLRAVDSTSNLRRFARRFLQREGLRGLQYYSLVRLDGENGLQEVSPEGDLYPIEPEDLARLEVLTAWQQEEPHTPHIVRPRGMWPLIELRLSSEYRWSCLARFTVPCRHDPDELLDWLGDV